MALGYLARVARRGSAFDIDRALDLARAMRQTGSIAELLTLRSRKAPLSAPLLAELADALASSAPPRTALATLQKYAAARPRDRTAWEGLATAQEEGHDFAAALATRTEIERRFGGRCAEPGSFRLWHRHRSLERS